MTGKSKDVRSFGAMPDGADVTNAEKKKRVLELFDFEPPPAQRGGSAGSRVEGREWATEMRELLTTQGFIVETAIAKSSEGERLDGNASERISYKMLRFKRSPLTRGRSLVVALNSAFEKYGNAQISELREQASYLNGLDDGCDHHPFAARSLRRVHARRARVVMTDDICIYCKQRGPMTREHVLPKALGGTRPVGHVDDVARVES
jgi:hypothetical protein